MVSTNFVLYLDNMIVLLSTGLLIRVHDFIISQQKQCGTHFSVSIGLIIMYILSMQFSK